MIRTGFKSKAPPRREAKQWVADELPGPRVPAQSLALRIPDGKARMTISLPKSAPKRNETYRRWVASLPCAHCGIAGYSNACHGDEGKGMSIKSSDETLWPGCVDRPGRRGCHSLIGASGAFTRDQRRALEQNYAARTKAQAISTNNWPEGWE